MSNGATFLNGILISMCFLVLILLGIGIKSDKKMSLLPYLLFIAIVFLICALVFGMLRDVFYMVVLLCASLSAIFFILCAVEAFRDFLEEERKVREVREVKQEDQIDSQKKGE